MLVCSGGLAGCGRGGAVRNLLQYRRRVAAGLVQTLSPLSFHRL